MRLILTLLLLILVASARANLSSHHFGNVVATNRYNQTSSAQWSPLRFSSYGPAPGYQSPTLSKARDGNVYDPTGRILKFDEPWELGHTPANKFSDAQSRAAQEGWDRQTWIRYQNDPGIYRPELPSSNASHKWE